MLSTFLNHVGWHTSLGILSFLLGQSAMEFVLISQLQLMPSHRGSNTQAARGSEKQPVSTVHQAESHEVADGPDLEPLVFCVSGSADHPISAFIFDCSV